MIFLERTAANVLVLILIAMGGVHPVTLVFTAGVVVFRAYTFGGTLGILFSVYRMSGALVAVVLYMPVHLLLDAIFLLAAALAFLRAVHFRFSLHDFKELMMECLCLAAFVVAICLLEAFLLLVLFHPLGNLI